MEVVLTTALRDTIKKVDYANLVFLHVDNAQEVQYMNAQNVIKDTISSIIDVFLNVQTDISPIYNQCLVISVHLLAKHAPTILIARHALLGIH